MNSRLKAGINSFGSKKAKPGGDIMEGEFVSPGKREHSETANSHEPTNTPTNPAEKTMTDKTQETNRTDQDQQPDLFEDELDAAISKPAHPTHTRSKKPTVTPPPPKQATAMGTKTLPSNASNLIQFTVKIDRILHGRLKYQTFKTGKKMAELIEDLICKNYPEL